MGDRRNCTLLKRPARFLKPGRSLKPKSSIYGGA